MPSWTEDQKQAIYKSGSNIIVSAGAGSGKTAVLTERVIKKIESGIHINELLILTFTKAAANEMKNRIRKSLKEGNFKEELQLIDSAYITTFDSYALSIVKKYHYLLNISSNISIVESTLINIEKHRIMDEVFNDYYEKENPMFEKLIKSFCVRDDDNLKRQLFTMTLKLEMIPDVNDYLDTYISKYYQTSNLQKRIQEYVQMLLDKIKELNLSIQKLASLDNDYYENVLDNLNGLLNAKNLDEILCYPNLKIPNLPRGSQDELKRVKDDISVKLKQIINLASYGNQKTILENILKTKDYVEIIIELVKDYLNRVYLYKRQNEMYEFTDIALLAIKVLKENKDVQDEVRKSLNEILVDEYQDTNDLQETFINLISNNNVYMVGDVKQSIYRFRNANPYIFKTKYDNYALGKDGIKIDLVKNFRSRDEVLTNINEIFDFVMDDLIGGAEYRKSHRMVFGNMTYLQKGKTKQDYNLEILEYDHDKSSEFTKEEIEIFGIATDIKKKVNQKFQVFDKDEQKLRNARFSDFVILMDRTTNFDLYKKIFEYLGVPLTLYKDETLNNNEDIYIIHNIITLIIKINSKKLDDEFKYSFISVSRSFLFEYTDEEIFNYFLLNNFKESSIYKLFSNIDINKLTTINLLELIIEKTHFYEKIIRVGDVEDRLIRIQKIMELAVNLSDFGYDIISFNTYLDTLVKQGYEIKYSLNNDDSDSVKIMTIHKSKGLEYHICYFSGLYKTFNISDLKDNFIYSNKYGFITPYFEEGINQTIYKELLKDDYLKEEISEKIRLFYVALTRAKEKMIMILPSNINDEVTKKEDGVISDDVRLNYRSFKDIIYSVKNYLEKYCHHLDLNNLGLTKDYLFVKQKQLDLNLNNEKIEVLECDNIEKNLKQEHFSKQTNKLTTLKEKENMEFGTKIHETLRYIDFKDYKGCDDKFIEEKITNFLNHSIMKDVNQAKIYKELEFTYIDEDIKYHGIIDLMLEFDDYINIIDYKLKNIENDAYYNQLMGYKKYISNKTNKKIYVYLYSLIDGKIKEIK